MVASNLNEEMGRAFDPWNVWNWLDAMLGLLTLWILEDIICTYTKRWLREVETSGAELGTGGGWISSVIYTVKENGT